MKKSMKLRQVAAFALVTLNLTACGIVHENESGYGFDRLLVLMFGQRERPEGGTLDESTTI